MTLEYTLWGESLITRVFEQLTDTRGRPFTAVKRPRLGEQLKRKGAKEKNKIENSV